MTVVPGENLDHDEVVAWCRSNLAGFKVPRFVVFGELPKTSTGKIQNSSCAMTPPRFSGRPLNANQFAKALVWPVFSVIDGPITTSRKRSEH